MWLLYCLSLQVNLLAWWWLEIVGRDDDDGEEEEENVFDWCLLIISTAVVAEEGGLLFWFDRCWSFWGVVGVDGEGVPCWGTFDEVNKSTWEWERGNWAWFDRSFDNRIDDEGTDGLFEWFVSKSFEEFVVERFGV